MPEQNTITTIPTPYLIKWGDTVSQLCQKHGIDIETFKLYNPQIADIDKIYEGDTLFLTEQVAVILPLPVDKPLPSVVRPPVNINLLEETEQAQPAKTPVDKAPAPAPIATNYSLLPAGKTQCKEQEDAENERFVYVEQTGGDIEQEVNTYALCDGDEVIEELKSCANPRGSFGTIVETALYRHNHVLSDMELVQKIGDIKTVLIPKGHVTNAALKDISDEFQHNVMIASVPTLTLDSDEKAVGPCRNGYLYFFLDGRLYREVKVSTTLTKASVFNDSNVAQYRSMSTPPDCREFSGPDLNTLMLPIQLSGKPANLQMAFSQDPWPWQHIEKLEQVKELRDQRCQVFITHRPQTYFDLLKEVSNGNEPRFSYHDFVANRNVGASYISFVHPIDHLPPMRPRCREYEFWLGSPRLYLEDVDASLWPKINQALNNERAFFDSDEFVVDDNYLPGLPIELLEEPAFQRENFFAAPLRNTLLQQWMAPNRVVNDLNGEQQEALSKENYPLLPPPEAVEDCFEKLREQHVIAIKLRDPLYLADKLLDAINSNITLLGNLSESWKYHPFGAAAELIHSNCFAELTPSGKENPLYVDRFIDQRVDLSPQGLYSRLTKKAERECARFNVVESSGLLAELMLDQGAASYAYAILDSVMFATADNLNPHILLLKDLEGLCVDLTKIDPRLNEKEQEFSFAERYPNRFKTERTAQGVIQQAIASILTTPANPIACLFYDQETCLERANLWATHGYHVEHEKLLNSLKNIQVQKSQLLILSAEDILAAGEKLAAESEMGTVDIMTVVRRATNGSEAVVAMLVPQLLNVFQRFNISSTVTINISTQLAGYATSLAGGAIPFEVRIAGQAPFFMVASDVSTLPPNTYNNVKSATAVATVNSMGMMVKNNPAGSQYQITGQRVSAEANKVTKQVYSNLWRGLFVFELYNLGVAIDDIGSKGFNFTTFLNISSAGTDGVLLALYYAQLHNTQHWYGVGAINIYLERKPAFLLGTGTMRTVFTSAAGLLTAATIAWDANSKFERGLNDAAKWKYKEAGAVAVASAAVFVEPAIKAVALRFFGHAIAASFGWLTAAITLGGIAASWYFNYRAANHSNDSFSAAIKYGPFGTQRTLASQHLAIIEQDNIADYEQQRAVEQSATSGMRAIDPEIDKQRWLTQSNGQYRSILNANKHTRDGNYLAYYNQLLSAILQGEMTLVSPEHAISINPAFSACNLVVCLYHPIVKAGNFRLTDQPSFELTITAPKTLGSREHVISYQQANILPLVEHAFTTADNDYRGRRYYGFTISDHQLQQQPQSAISYDEYHKARYRGKRFNIFTTQAEKEDYFKQYKPHLSNQRTVSLRVTQFTGIFELTLWDVDKKQYISHNRTRELELTEAIVKQEMLAPTRSTAFV